MVLKRSFSRTASNPERVEILSEVSILFSSTFTIDYKIFSIPYHIHDPKNKDIKMKIRLQKLFGSIMRLNSLLLTLQMVCAKFDIFRFEMIKSRVSLESPFDSGSSSCTFMQ